MRRVPVIQQLLLFKRREQGEHLDVFCWMSHNGTQEDLEMQEHPLDCWLVKEIRAVFHTTHQTWLMVSHDQGEIKLGGHAFDTQTPDRQALKVPSHALSWLIS